MSPKRNPRAKASSSATAAVFKVLPKPVKKAARKVQTFCQATAEKSSSMLVTSFFYMSLRDSVHTVVAIPRIFKPLRSTGRLPHQSEDWFAMTMCALSLYPKL